MSKYSEFLELIYKNTNCKADSYKGLCRFCLRKQPHVIDIGRNNYNSQKQREAILNNYCIITQQILPTTDIYPTFVCISCEKNLSHFGLFAQQVKENAENWETFLGSGTDIRKADEEHASDEQLKEIEEIKIEPCEPIFDDALDGSSLKHGNTDPTSKSLMKRINFSTYYSSEYERTCKLCDEPTFSSMRHLYCHYKKYHPGEKIFTCDICGAKFINKSSLSTHMKDRHGHHDRKFQCQYCAKLFYSDREVKGHEKLHLNARSYVCTLCGRGFNQKTCLNLHLKSKLHNADYKPINKKHRHKSHSKKSFRCIQCVPSTVYSSAEERDLHRNEVHKIFDCNVCKNSFLTLESLDRHKLQHSYKPRRFVCSVCDATFNQSSHLSSHFKRKHTVEKPFECSFCSRRFFENYELNAHIRVVHNKHLRFKCDICESDFGSMKYLQKHILDRHSTEASPYDCKICGKKNVNAANLELHRLKKNTGNKVDNYKGLCRFCLAMRSDGIDVGKDSKQQREQRESILSSYSVITKQLLPIHVTYPTFVCSSCEDNLKHYALYTRKIEKNAENWEMFLKNVNDDGFIPTPVEEIKIECCALQFEDVPVTSGCDALELPAMKVEMDSKSIIQPKKSKIDKATAKYINCGNLSTEYERTCKLCEAPTFPSLARFYKHQQWNHPGEKSFICDSCGSKFNNKTRLAAHMKDRHATCGRMHQCQFCAKLFYSDREVKGHEMLHLNARSYVCSLCGKGFNQKTTLNVHLKSKAHNVDYKTVPYTKRPYNYIPKKAYRCQLCVPSTLFSSSMERSAHRNAMHRKFVCDICKNSFMAQESLDSHKLLHSDKPRPFVCQVCNATFNQSSHLSSHFKRKHTEDKSFHCSDCDKSFFESCELNAHVRLVHKKQERVKCDQCDCDFATEKYLQKHVLQKHTAEASPYDCKICGKRMENGVRLDQH
ncbi:Zinc finger protein, partial [Pseudolycoriella hygida]